MPVLAQAATVEKDLAAGAREREISQHDPARASPPLIEIEAREAIGVVHRDALYDILEGRR